MTWNLFQSLRDDAHLAGTEDLLTASLVSLINGVREVQHRFLLWIQPHVHIALDPLAGCWHASGQFSCPTKRFGNAVIDMVLARGASELWFEHKVDAALSDRVTTDGSGEVIGQLQKYNCHARPEYEAKNKGRSVLLFAITKRAISIPIGDLGDIHNEQNR